MNLTFRQWLYRIRKEELDDKRAHLKYLRGSANPLIGYDRCHEIAKTNKAVLELSESLNIPKQEVTQEHIDQLKGRALCFSVVFLIALWVILAT